MHAWHVRRLADLPVAGRSLVIELHVGRLACQSAACPQRTFREQVPELALRYGRRTLKQTYADALVTKWKIGRVWQGFGQVQDFVDCLCGALTCWTRGCEAVYALTGTKAVVDCKDDAKAAYCTKLRDETMQQVLARYDRRCARKDDDEPGESGSNGDERGGGHGGAHDDCGCHGHHDHHHHHGHHDCGCGH